MSFTLTPLNVDEEKWQRIRSKFARDGVDVPDSASGEISQSGVTASFTWDGSTLRVTVLHKPLLFPEAIVKSHLEDYIETA